MPWGGWSALYYSLLLPSWARFDMTWIAWVYPLTQAATAATWLWEATFPLLLLCFWHRATRTRGGRLRQLSNRLDLRSAYVLMGVFVHVGIWATMNVGPFSWASLAYYLCLYHHDEWARLGRRLRAPRRRRPPVPTRPREPRRQDSLLHPEVLPMRRPILACLALLAFASASPLAPTVAHAEEAAPLFDGLFVELLPVGDLPGDGVTPVTMHMLTLDATGAPLQGVEIKTKVETGALSEPIEVVPGLFRWNYTPAEVETTSPVSIEIKARRRSRRSSNAPGTSRCSRP